MRTVASLCGNRLNAIRKQRSCVVKEFPGLAVSTMPTCESEVSNCVSLCAEDAECDDGLFYNGQES